MLRTERTILFLIMAVGLSGFSFPAIRAPQFSLPMGNWNPVVGRGAAYDVQLGNQRFSMELAVVGKETVDGVEGYWLEMSSNLMNRNIIMKVLRVGNEFKRIITQQGNSEPIEMDAKMMGGMLKRMMPGIAEESSQDLGKLMGKESVTVPAGTFQCHHYQNTKDGQTVDVWISPEVPLHGAVKLLGPNSTMILTNVIKNYKTKITRTPVKM